MTGAHQGISVESGALRVYSEESDDPLHPCTVIRCGSTSSFTQDYGLNTILCGRTNTQNHPFVAVSAVQSVIKDLCCGSHKCTQTHVYQSAVDVSVHMCIHASTSVFMHVFFARGDKEGGEATAGRSFTPSRQLMLHRTTTSQQKQLELSPLGYTTFSVQPPGRK